MAMSVDADTPGVWNWRSIGPDDTDVTSIGMLKRDTLVGT